MFECICLECSDGLNLVSDASNDVSVLGCIERGDFLTGVRSGRVGPSLAARTLYFRLALVI